MSRNSHILTLRKIEPDMRDQKPRHMDTWKDVYGGQDDGTATFGDVVTWSVQLDHDEVATYTADETRPSNLIGLEKNHTDYADEEADAPRTVNGIPEPFLYEYHKMGGLLRKLQKDPSLRKIDNLRIAVLDTGCDLAFPLRKYVTAGKSFVEGEPWDRTTHYHGMHCAGSAYPYGVGARLLIAKVLGNNGSGSRDDIVAGMHWAIDSGAHVISMSISGEGSDSASYEAALSRARGKGIFVACSAGNTGRNEKRVPASIKGAHAIGSLDGGGTDRRSDFSTYGDYLFGCADGARVLSYTTGGKTQRSSGTSMATPTLAQEVALLYIAHGKRLGDVEKALVAGAKKLSPEIEHGAGHLLCGPANWRLSNG